MPTTLDQLLPRSVRDALDDIVRRRATVKLQLDVKDGVVRGASARESHVEKVDKRDRSDA
jgi:hypothetical protein